MANIVGTEQTAPLGAVCSGSTLFASILNYSGMLGYYFAADNFSRGHFQMHFSAGFFIVCIYLSDRDLQTTLVCKYN